jgi:leader peptidase (prepilin peptidase) / N-methyltransferase
MTADALQMALAGVFGLVMGSAMSAIAHRVPRRISWFAGRSQCPSCQHVLGPSDLLPVLSFAWSRGRCRHCGAHVSWRYPLTEIACAAWAVLLYRLLGLSLSWVALSVWGCLLVALAWIDFEFQLLPDALTFPGTLLALGWALTQPGGAHHALLGMVAGSGVLWLLAWLWLNVRRVEGMGFGDVKLAAMFGAVLGWQLTLLTLFVAALIGSLWGVALILARRGSGRTALPFGTLLAPSAMVVFLWGGGWLQAYLGVFPHR